MTVIRDDDDERLARAEHMAETIKKRREDVPGVVQESEQAVESAASTLDCQNRGYPSCRPRLL